MGWSPDFCLSCDRETSGEAYCSQACRLADLETSSCGSEPASPTSARPPPSHPNSGSGFYLPPAFNFSAYRSSSIPPSPPATHTSSHTQTSFFSNQTTYFSSPQPRSQSVSSQGTSSTSMHGAAPKRILTPSSSRTSLNSLQSISTQGSHLSDQARNELRSYTSSFDQVRDWKRRMTAT